MSMQEPLDISVGAHPNARELFSGRADIFSGALLPAIEKSDVDSVPEDGRLFEPIKSLYNKAQQQVQHEPLITSFSQLGKSIAIYGGSFDPLHMDHIRVALSAIEHLGPDTAVVFMPNKRNPDKPGGPKTSNPDRLEMLREGLSRFPGLYVSDFEMNSPKDRPMTYDTMDFVRAEVGKEASLRLILGSDILSRHHYFNGIDAKSAIFRPLFIERHTFDASKVQELSQKLALEDFLCISQSLISVGNLPLSSTIIRELLEVGQLDKELLPPGVFEIILRKSHYASTSEVKHSSSLPPLH
jgi:nicotinate-nucleotide adenylyltransferase